MSTALAIDGTNRVHVLWHVHHDSRRVADQFMHDIGTLVKRLSPSQVIVAFDGAECFRREIDPTYKLGRAVKDDGLYDSLVACFGASRRAYPTVELSEFEADDVLATVAAECVSAGQRCVIASPDKDLRQCLVRDWVSILRGWKGSGARFDPTWMTAATLEAEFGIGPDQWIDYQCLVGDDGDNITGAEGIGDKTARKILFEGGSLDAVLGNRWLSSTLGKSERLWAAVKALETRLPIVRQLVTLRTDVPGVVELMREVAAV